MCAQRLWLAANSVISDRQTKKMRFSHMPDTTSRRGFLSFFTQLLVVAIGLLLLVPGIAYFAAPLRKRGGADRADEGFADAGMLADFPIGEWRLATIEVVRRDGWEEKARTQHAVWVRRSSGTEPPALVLSPICPHLGCQVEWHPKTDEFACPCHKGIFKSNGEVVSGPPPRGMDELQSKVQAGRLLVQWRDFKNGVAERVPVDL
jgi:Rieske Fe-S protein